MCQRGRACLYACACVVVYVYVRLPHGVHVVVVLAGPTLPAEAQRGIARVSQGDGAHTAQGDEGVLQHHRVRLQTHVQLL